MGTALPRVDPYERIDNALGLGRFHRGLGRTSMGGCRKDDAVFHWCRAS